MGRIHRVSDAHRNSCFIQNEKGEFMHFIFLQGEKGYKINFQKSHFGASFFYNKKNAQKFIDTNGLKNCRIVKARPIIKKQNIET